MPIDDRLRRRGRRLAGRTAAGCDGAVAVDQSLPPKTLLEAAIPLAVDYTWRETRIEQPRLRIQEWRMASLSALTHRCTGFVAVVIVVHAIVPGFTAAEQASTLRVRAIEEPPRGPQVRISQPFGRRGPTSIRHTTDAERNLKQSPNAVDAKYNNGRYWKRDRDLGQTFTIPEGEPFTLDAITLRVGPSGYGTFDIAGAPGAKVSLQIMKVSGEPAINDNGTTAGTVSNAYPNRPEADDYVTGETYGHLIVARGGVLPKRLALGGPVPGDTMKTYNTTRPTKLSTGTLLRFDLLGDAEIELTPGRRYAFLILFDEPAPSRALPLDNWDKVGVGGGYEGGHAIRREGSLAPPWEHLPQVFNGAGEDRSASELPSDWETRLRQQPTTWGRPDVDTYRDLLFYVEGK